eukprot:TRINITY_DN30212_c0_g1_i1.p1 TRINITY_DN30212_c0_g1~~TRINITY_DN30212_c0_g1_i1.p1  ORF type:complete len:144 (+),score=38.06 TRINITY_DN30212_c0_g1_i1:141-572(+)
MSAMDAAQVGPDGYIMLGDLRKKECFHISQIDTILQKMHAQRAKTGTSLTGDMKKAMDYCRRFKPLKNDRNAATAKAQLLRLVDRDGKRQKRCQDFEAAQLLNLMPASVDEARNLIPTLDQNIFLDELVKEIQPMRDFDRAIA